MKFAPSLKAVLVSTCLFAPAFAKAEAPKPQPEQMQAQKTVAPPVAQDQQKARPTIEVAFVLDTTSSMGGLIEGAKQKIWSIASKIARGQPTPRLKVGLVAYRDVGDAYVTQRFDLTEDLDQVFVHLRAFQADGGGDTPEHVGRGLGEAVKFLSWSQDPKTMKLIYLVGDAPPQRYQDGWDAYTWATNAIHKGIVVNTVRCGDMVETEAAWKQLARLGDGTYTSIGQTGGMVAVRTPYDDKLAELNASIASKTIYTGGGAARAEAKKKAEEVAAMPVEAAADRMGFFNNAGAGKGGAPAALAPKAATGAVDVTAKPADLDRVAESDLDEPLRKMKPEQRKAYVEQTAKERAELEQKAMKIAQERQAWLDKNAAEKADSFDGKVMDDVKTRAAKIGVSY